MNARKIPVVGTCMTMIIHSAREVVAPDTIHIEAKQTERKKKKTKSTFRMHALDYYRCRSTTTTSWSAIEAAI